MTVSKQLYSENYISLFVVFVSIMSRKALDDANLQIHTTLMQLPSTKWPADQRQVLPMR
jgi:hypothetical protein